MYYTFKRPLNVCYLTEELEGNPSEIPKESAYWIYYLVYFWISRPLRVISLPDKKMEQDQWVDMLSVWFLNFFFGSSQKEQRAAS